MSVVACQAHHLAVQVRNLPLDSLTSLEQRLYHSGEFRPILGQLRGTHGKHVHLCAADYEPEILEETADLVLDISLDLDEQSSANEERLDRVTFEIFDANLLVPSTLHDACDAHGVVRYLSQLETADRQEPTEALTAKAEHLKEKLARLDTEMKRLESYEKKILASPDQQISLTDPDSRSMATSGRGSGVVGYNVQVAVETENHLIVTHNVTTSGSDRSQLARVGKAAKAVMRTDVLDAVADRGYFNSPEILECHEAGITVTLPKPMTSGAKAEGRFGKQDFVYVETQDVYICPAGQALTYRMTTQEGDKAMRRYWTTACGSCPLKKKCTTAPERRIPRWEHEHVLEAVQARLDADPQAMRRRRETVEHPFGTLKARMGATHFLMRTLPKVAAEMALHVLAYNLTRVMNIMGVKPLLAAIGV